MSLKPDFFVPPKLSDRLNITFINGQPVIGTDDARSYARKFTIHFDEPVNIKDIIGQLNNTSLSAVTMVEE